MNVGQMLSKHLIGAVLLVAICLLGTGIYFIAKEKPEAELRPTQLTVSPSAYTIQYAREWVSLVATLASNGASVEGKVINWSVTPGIGIGIPPSITNSSGQASIYFPYLPPPPSSIEFSQLPATLTFTASFAGDNQYRGSTGSTSIELELAQGLRFETISLIFDGGAGGHYHAYLVIENAEEWERILPFVVDTWYPLPEIDFSTHAVIAVFMGVWATGGYEILIEQIIDAENEIIVNVKEIYPGRIYVTEAFTSPRHVIRIERVQKPIVFEVRQFKVHAWDENWNPYDRVMYELVGEHRVEPGSGPPEPSI